MNTLEPPPPIVSDERAEYIKGVGKLEGRLLMLLDINKILTGSEKERLFEAPEA